MTAEVATTPRALAEAPAERCPEAIWLLVIGLIIWATSAWIGFTSALGLTTAMAFAAAIAGVKHPVLGLLGISILCTLDPITRLVLATPGSLYRWSTLNYWFMVIMATSVPLILRLNDLHSTLLKGFIALLAVEILISPVLALGYLLIRDLAINHILNIAVLFGMLVYFARANGARPMWYWMAVLNGALAGASGLAYNLQMHQLPRDAVANTNAAGLVPLSAIFVVCLGFSYASRHRRGTLVLGALAAVNWVWVFLTASRGNLLMGTIGLIYLVLVMPGVSRRASYVAVTVVTALVLSSSFTGLQERALFRIEKTLNPNVSIRSRTSGRSDLMLGGWYIVQENPLGIGTGGFAIAWANLGIRPGLSSFKQSSTFQAHSGWLKVLTENGILGLLFLAAYVWSFAYIGMRYPVGGARGLGLYVTATLMVAFFPTEFQCKGLWFLAAGGATFLQPGAMARAIQPHRRSNARLLRSTPRRLSDAAPA